MEQPAEARARTEQTPRPHDEVADGTGPGWRPVYGLIVFGLLLTATLTIDGFADVPPMPGTALVAAGLMLSMGVADLLDPAVRRLVVGVRIGGYVMALLGLAVQLVG
ncbi:MAG TPA: hypothetical protein K8W24_15750 [Brachybacterium paraconglomeratum]|mgnify:FL=1|uniref:Uncharacterized protein n=1 Tax=Brachybacterium paraconglomeratum TaxID=173362 RepID=A0A921GRY4_9MICO|nr:hypothetical protein [Brachybacterium paraconglomeratum]